MTQTEKEDILLGFIRDLEDHKQQPSIPHLRDFFSRDRDATAIRLELRSLLFQLKNDGFITLGSLADAIDQQEIKRQRIGIPGVNASEADLDLHLFLSAMLTDKGRDRLRLLA